MPHQTHASNVQHLPSMRYRGLFRLWSRPCLCVGGFVVWTSMSSLFLFAPWGLARRSKRVHDPSATGDGLLWYGCLGAKSMANADFTRTGLLTMLLCFLLAHTMGADTPEKYQRYHGHNGGKGDVQPATDAPYHRKDLGRFQLCHHLCCNIATHVANVRHLCCYQKNFR